MCHEDITSFFLYFLGLNTKNPAKLAGFLRKKEEKCVITILTRDCFGLMNNMLRFGNIITLDNILWFNR